MDDQGEHVFSERNFNPNGRYSFQGTCSLEAALASDVWVVCVPVQALREFLRDLKKKWLKETLKGKVELFPKIILTCKGVEKETGFFPLEIFQQVLEESDFADADGSPMDVGCFAYTPLKCWKRGFLSGPNFSLEMLQGQLSVSEVFFCHKDEKEYDKGLAETFCSDFSSNVWMLKPCPWGSLLEVSGAFKNIVAVGMGMIEAFGGGRNISASFLAQAFEEKMHFLSLFYKNQAIFGCKNLPWANFFDKQPRESLGFQSFLGDFFATCSSLLSRNYTFGKQRGEIIKKVWLPQHQKQTSEDLIRFLLFGDRDVENFYVEKQEVSFLAEGFLSLLGISKRMSLLKSSFPLVQRIFYLCAAE